MAQKRMFSLQIVDTDAFLDMPMSSQFLYFHLSMRADDEGFVSSPKKIMKMVGSSDDDLKVLIAKRFILTFESGVVVIKHWLIHNTIRMDRFNPTTYQKEKQQIEVKENGSYTELATKWQPVGNQLVPQVKLSKVNLIKDKLDSTLIFELFKDNKEEANKFIDYWTEKSKSGKERWQAEKFFDIKRRVKTWLDRTNNFSNKDDFKVIS